MMQAKEMLRCAAASTFVRVNKKMLEDALGQLPGHPGNLKQESTWKEMKLRFLLEYYTCGHMADFEVVEQ